MSMILITAPSLILENKGSSYKLEPAKKTLKRKDIEGQKTSNVDKQNRREFVNNEDLTPLPLC